MSLFEKIKRMPTVKAVMTPFPYSVELDAPLQEAEEIMEQHDIRHLPVMDRGKPVSVISGREIRYAIDAAGGPRREKLRVEDACSGEAYIVELSEPLDQVLAHMAKHHVDCTLVVKEGRLAGVFTLTDAFKAFADLLRSVFPREDDGHAA
jgi:CBS domain-containing protein